MRIDSKTRKIVIDRANGLCEECGSNGDFRGLAIHHDPPTKMGGTKRKYTPEMLKVLCYPCHNLRHGIRER